MRSILWGILLVFAASFSASAGVLYSFSQTPYNPPGSYPSPTINFDFTAPSLLTNSTVIPGSSIDAPVIHYMGLDLSILSVTVDPGLNNSDASYIGSRGVPFIGVRMGWGNQEVMSEGVCFDSNFSCFSTLSPMGAQAFDHFGTYTHGDVQLTISSTDTNL